MTVGLMLFLLSLDHSLIWIYNSTVSCFDLASELILCVFFLAMPVICSVGCIAGVIIAGMAVLVAAAAVLCIIKRQSKCTYTKFDIHSL